jgi:TetR/AcrR family transcriptional regulator
MVDAAQRLILERGEQWTTQELAKEAGVAIQTFYRYFGSKDQLLLAVIENMMTESAEQYAAEASLFDDPVARLRSYVTSVFAALKRPDLVAPRFITAQHWRLHQLFPEELSEATQPLTDLLAAEIRSAQDAGLLAETDADWAASFVTRLVMAEFHLYAFAPQDVEIDELAERVWGFCLTGLGGSAAAETPKSRKRPRA